MHINTRRLRGKKGMVYNRIRWCGYPSTYCLLLSVFQLINFEFHKELALCFPAGSALSIKIRGSWQDAKSTKFISLTVPAKLQLFSLMVL